MRVLHVYSGNLFGGVETLLVTLARQRHLCPEMEPQFALCFEGRLSEELQGTNVGVHMLGGVRTRLPWTILQARRALGKLLARESYDVVVCHACWSHAMFAPVVRIAESSLVFWAHDASRGRHWLERWARRTPPDLVLANSRFTQSHLNSLFGGVPSQVLYLPVSPPPPCNRTDVRRRVRADLRTPTDAVVIIQASRLERWKGHCLLLEALAQLKDVPDWICWIAGGAQRPREAAYLEELDSLAANSGISDRVRFLGQRADVPALLAAADIHCQPNTGPEPFGVSFVEALYAGLPVVTTSMGGAVEIVDDSCGVLVSAEPRALTNALSELLANRAVRDRLASGGPRRASALCNPRNQLGALSETLNTLPKQQMHAGSLTA